MNYYIIPPTKRLTDFVRYFWVFEGDASSAEPYIHRTYASVCPELLFHYKGPFSEHTIDHNPKNSFVTGIHAQTKQYRQFLTQQPFGIFGVYLYPYALSVLFDIPAIELTNELPDLYSILKKEDRWIEEKMMTAKDNKQRVSIIAGFLERRIKALKRAECAQIARIIIDAKGQIGIGELSAQCSLSVRQFQRNFKELSGFPPKTFARIVRFSALLGDNTLQQKSLTELAYIFGYYDQSHFIADFREFSGLSPKAWFNNKLINFSPD